MCLVTVDSEIKRRFGVGYKVVMKVDGKYKSWDYTPNRGVITYPTDSYLTDPNKGTVRAMWEDSPRYPAGFHVSLDLGGILPLYPLVHRYFPGLVIIKVRYKRVVASGSDPTYGSQVVARQIRVIKEMPAPDVV